MTEHDRLNRPVTHGAGGSGGRCGMRISVVAGVGVGQTSLSAFDDALWRCGAHNYNLIALSSVIPPASRIALIERHVADENVFGDRLYVVKAEARSVSPGAIIAAGVGWFQWGHDQGVFVEHEIESPDGTRHDVKAELARQISVSLRDLAARRGIEFAEERAGSRIEVAQSGELPTCVLVLAIYESERWRAHARDIEEGASVW